MNMHAVGSVPPERKGTCARLCACVCVCVCLIMYALKQMCISLEIFAVGVECR